MPRSQPTHRSREKVVAILGAFSESESISRHTLAYWVLRARREAESTTVLATISPPPRGSAEPFEVEFSGVGIRVHREATDEDWRTLREAWTS